LVFWAKLLVVTDMISPVSMTIILFMLLIEVLTGCYIQSFKMNAEFPAN